MTDPGTIPAVFLDRDGTIIEDRGHLRSPSEVVFFPGTIPALRRLQKGFKFFIVTHQPGIADGTIQAAQVARVNDHVVTSLARAGIRIERVYCCPHRRSDDCECIKPKTYYLHMAAREFGIDLGRSFVIGDHPHDVEMARNAGATGIYVLTGHGTKHRSELPPGALVAADIGQAVQRIFEIREEEQGERTLDGEVAEAAASLRAGGVVAFPTETVYGLGANAFDARAVARVFEIKRRPRFDPLIVHVSSVEEARSIVMDFPRAARELAARFWPGPLTLVLPKGPRIPDIVTAGLPNVAVRIPDHPLALALIRETDAPLAAPSANPFGRISPTTAEHVRKQLGRDMDRVLDGGPCRVGIESTILSLVGRRPVLLRAGGVSVEDIEAVTGPVSKTAGRSDRPSAPGQLPQHYAPRTPLAFHGEADLPTDELRVGLLSFREPATAQGFAAVEVLSTTGDLKEAAANFFASLHRLDSLDLDLIVAEAVPDTGLGLAINDRLRRAARGSGRVESDVQEVIDEA